MPSREASPNGDCIFCAIAEGVAPSETVFRDEHTMAFMDINPVSPGHALVIPTHHARDLFDIGEQDALRVMATTLRITHLVREVVRPDGMNIIQANGAAAAQSVFHLHFHVIPRFVSDPIVIPFARKKGVAAEIRETANRIRAFSQG